MKLTKKKAIEFCKRMWTRFAKTGETKEDYKYTKEELAYCEPYPEPANDCWFCEYDNHKRVVGEMAYCDFCPYHKKYGHCNEDGTPYNKWAHARCDRTRKKYAAQFLKKIEALERGKK